MHLIDHHLCACFEKIHVLGGEFWSILFPVVNLKLSEGFLFWSMFTEV